MHCALQRLIIIPKYSLGISTLVHILSQAYDSVDRGKMFKTLEELGIGPKFIQTVKSMYTGDYIINEQHGEKTRPLYLGRGLRQVGFHFLVGT